MVVNHLAKPFQIIKRFLDHWPWYLVGWQAVTLVRTDQRTLGFGIFCVYLFFSLYYSSVTTRDRKAQAGGTPIEPSLHEILCTVALFFSATAVYYIESSPARVYVILLTLYPLFTVYYDYNESQPP